MKEKKITIEPLEGGGLRLIEEGGRTILMFAGDTLTLEGPTFFDGAKLPDVVFKLLPLAKDPEPKLRAALKRGAARVFVQSEHVDRGLAVTPELGTLGGYTVTHVASGLRVTGLFYFTTVGEAVAHLGELLELGIDWTKSARECAAQFMALPEATRLAFSPCGLVRLDNLAASESSP